MKRILMLLMIVVLLAGCDLRNRQRSEDFIPTGTDSFETGFVTPVNGGDPLLPQEKTVIKTVLSYQGEIPLTEPVVHYSYQLPMIDLSGAQAMGCNQEIEERFGTLIRQSLQAMDHYEPPILERMSFTSFTYGEILTLRVDRRDHDGATSEAYYTVDAKTGEAVSVAALFAAAGVSGTPETVINQAVLALFTSRFGEVEGADAATTTALYRTQAQLQPLTANRMHLTENGRLIVALELFAPNGGSSIEELSFP